jgi:hypothetical protein
MPAKKKPRVVAEQIIAVPPFSAPEAIEFAALGRELRKHDPKGFREALDRLEFRVMAMRQRQAEVRQ